MLGTTPIAAKTLQHMQARVARDSITASALRQSVAGTVTDVQLYLSTRLDLARFATAARRDFKKAHETEWKALQAYLARGQRSHEFGRCAKSLDIFLRSAATHCHLRDAFGLQDIEPLLFLPLDNLTMRNVRAWAKERALPTTPIYKLEIRQYDAYQASAAAWAKERGELRVWLDDEFWGVQAKTG